MILRGIQICLFLLFSNVAISQKTVTGTVTDAQSGEALIGVNIRLVGSATGTTSDLDGNYSIEVAGEESQLSFSYTGFKAQEVIVGNRQSIDVALLTDTEVLKEVVVVGYGTQKKENLTGAVSTVSAEDLEEANATSMAQALQGRSAGVNVSSTGGAPGGTPSIRVRGVGSINNNAQPVVVIDGIISTTGALAALNPQDIESLSVLKDAASASIYGARSSNGVILVKTRQGKSGKLSISYNSRFGIAQVPNRQDILNADEYRDYYADAYETHNNTYNSDQRVLPPAYTDAVWEENGRVDTDWQDLIVNENAFLQNHYLSFSGGNDYSSYMLSLNYGTEEGIGLNTNNDLYSIRLNSEHKVFEGRVRIGENAVFSNREGRLEATRQFFTAAITSPLMPVFNPANRGGFQGPDPQFTGVNDRTNPLAELELRERNNDVINFMGNIYAEVDILKGLTFRTVFGGSYGSSRDTRWTPRYDLNQRSNPTASFVESSFYSKNWQFDQILTYNTSINETHNIDITAGHTSERREGDFLSGSTNDFRWESLRTINGGSPEFTSSSQFVSLKTNESFFGRVNYNFRGKYLFSGTIRRDGSSRFGPNNRYGTFPAASVGWKISEDFFRSEQYDWIDLLKVRFGYGLSGNEPDDDFLYDTFIDIYNEHVYTLGTNNTPVFGAAPFYNYGSPELKWESAEMTNIGLDFIGWEGRAELYAEYFIKNQNDLITNLPLQAVYGLSNDAQPPLVNLGDISNRGFEINAIYKNSDNPLQYQFSFNLTKITNTVERLPSSRIFSENGFNIATVGHSIGSYYGFVGERILQESDFAQNEDGSLVQDEDGRYTLLHATQQDFTAPGDIKFADLNQDGVVNAADQTIIGKTIPDFSYGFTIDLSYRAFDLNILFQGVQNVDLYNLYRANAGLAAGNQTSKDENKLREVLNYWTPENPVEDQTRIGLADFNANGRISSWWVEDASFLRLRNLQIGYTLPSVVLQTLRISNLRIYVGGENLLTFTDYTGYDPEVASLSPFGAIDIGAYPVPRNYQAGINISF